MRLLSTLIITLFVIGCNNLEKKEEDIRDTAISTVQMSKRLAYPDTIFTGLVLSRTGLFILHAKAIFLRRV